MRIRRTLVSMATALLISGCTMIPDFDAPPPPVAQGWPSDAAGTPVRAAQPVVWTEFFRTPELRGLIATALENNRDLRVAALNVEAARAAYRIRRADIMPQVDAGAGASRSHTPDAAQQSPLAPQLSSRYDADLSVTAFELDVFGRIRSLNRAAVEDFLAVRENRAAVQVALVAEVANAWLQWQADRRILDVARQTLESTTRTYDLVDASHKNGVGSRLDVAQARAAVETARADVALYSRLGRQDRNALVLLLGVAEADLPGPAGFADGSGEAALFVEVPVGLPSDVLLTRPDIRAAEHRLMAANADIGAARAAFFPRISLTGSVGLASTSLSDLFSSGAATAWNFAPDISVPVFAGGRNVAGLEQAELRREIAVAEYEKTIRTAFREVADELAGRATLEEQLAAQRDVVDAAREAYDLSRARHKAGVDSFLTVLDAQRTLYDAEQQEIRVRQEYLANRVNLYKALGGGGVSMPASQVSEPVAP